MAVILPQSLPASAGWQLVDWRRDQATTPPAANGLATVDLGQIDPEEMWLIDRIVVSCTSTTATTLRLYESTPDPGRLLDLTSAGNLNTADYSAGLLMRPSTSLIAQWSGASTGAVGTLSVQARIMRRT